MTAASNRTTASFVRIFSNFHAIGGAQIAGRLERQPRFPDATRADQGQQPAVALFEAIGQLRQFGFATDERGGCLLSSSWIILCRAPDCLTAPPVLSILLEYSRSS